MGVLCKYVAGTHAHAHGGTGYTWLSPSSHMVLCLTGQKHVIGHLHIPVAMATPQRTHTDAPSRRNVKVAVAICKLGGVYIKELTGTKYNGCKPIKEYKNDNGKVLTCMGGQEYCDFLRGAKRHFMRQAAFSKRSAEAMLVHDKSTPHQSKVATEALARLRLKAVVQPPRSPDLMPLDYGIFGRVKTAIAGRVKILRTWEESVSELEKKLLAARSDLIDSTIDQFPRRLEACIASLGDHLGKPFT